MKKQLLILLCFGVGGFVRAQSLVSVASGTDLSIVSGTTFTAGTLALTPSATFTMNGLSISQAATVSHSTPNLYVGRVFQFSSNTNPFSGTITIGYLDAELNTLAEPLLKVTANDGSSWLSFPSATNDVVNNYVQASPVSARVISELILGTTFSVLPLQWGSVKATRLAQEEKVEWNTLQENNVTGFTVEKSYDGVSWATVQDNIAATNTSVSHTYSITDHAYEAGKVYYRISQHDFDGHTTYSPTVQIAGLDNAHGISLYPNPATAYFYISRTGGSALKEITLFNNAGAELKHWSSPQSVYKIDGLPAGLYRVKALLQDGTTANLNVLKW